jgi:hypothetical protein
MCETKVVNKVKTHTLYSVTIFLQKYHKMEKYGTAGQATDGSIIERMRIVCGVSDVPYAHSEYVMLNV